VPTAPVPVAEEPEPKPVDTDPDPVPGTAVKPPSLKNVPAVAASQAGAEAAGGSDGSILPLALALVAVAVVGLAFGLRRGRPASG
jgi:hypothetical protein